MKTKQHKLDIYHNTHPMMITIIITPTQELEIISLLPHTTKPHKLECGFVMICCYCFQAYYYHYSLQKTVIIIIRWKLNCVKRISSSSSYALACYIMTLDIHSSFHNQTVISSSLYCSNHYHHH